MNIIHPKDQAENEKQIMKKHKLLVYVSLFISLH